MFDGRFSNREMKRWYNSHNEKNKVKNKRGKKEKGNYNKPKWMQCNASPICFFLTFKHSCYNVSPDLLKKKTVPPPLPPLFYLSVYAQVVNILRVNMTRFFKEKKCLFF